MATDATAAAFRSEWQARMTLVGVATGMAVMLELALQQAFCALLGSKFAAVVASGQNTGWLIDNCRALADSHAELPESDRQAIRKALEACRSASKRRNDLVHSLMLTGPDNVLAVQSKRLTHRVQVTPWTTGQIRGVTTALVRAEHGLAGAVEGALGAEAMALFGQLRSEDERGTELRPGHDQERGALL